MFFKKKKKATLRVRDSVSKWNIVPTVPSLRMHYFWFIFLLSWKRRIHHAGGGFFFFVSFYF